MNSFIEIMGLAGEIVSSDRMANFLLVCLSLLVWVVCWWLSHQNAEGREPFGKRIAAGYGVTGMMILILAVARVQNFPVKWIFNGFLLALLYTLFWVSMRLYELWDKPKNGGAPT